MDEVAATREWQPIETAPKDGTEFLAYDIATGKQDVCAWRARWNSVEAVQYDGEYGPLSGEFGGNSLDANGNLMDSKITHWMPLPDPPKAAK